MVVHISITKHIIHEALQKHLIETIILTLKSVRPKTSLLHKAV